MVKVNKAIILAGGNATRLYPLNLVTSKHLFLVHDKPMIYYSISTLLKAGIKKYLIISSPDHIYMYKKLLGDGSRFGIEFNYKIQKNPNGLPEAFLLGKKFIGSDPIALNLGDHFFYGDKIDSTLKNTFKNFQKSIFFSYPIVNNNNSYGVIRYNKDNLALEIIEKPNQFISNRISCGLYVFDSDVCKVSSKLLPSSRNELEMSDLINEYLKINKIIEIKLNKKNIWSDMGTIDGIYETTKTARKLTSKNKHYGYLEFDSYENGLISLKLLNKYCKSSKSNYDFVLNRLRSN